MIQDLTEPAVANFVQKSFEIISVPFQLTQNQDNSNIIEWLPSGKQFIIKDTDLFESVILPHYFRHRNINSFIRQVIFVLFQLNMYGFHKSRKEPTKNIFSHPNFLKGKPELLVNVRRKLKEEKSDQNTPGTNGSKKVKEDSVQEKPKAEDPKEPLTSSTINKPSSFFMSKDMLISKQHIETNIQKREKQLEKTAIKADYLVSLCSMENINMQDFGPQNNKSNDWPFRSLIEKSQIMELNPEIYGLKFENITSLHHIEELEFDFSSGNDQNQQNSMDEIEKERKKLNNRMAGYNILQTINFMSQLNL